MEQHSTARREDDPVLLKTLRLEETDHTPVWFMRQAGRSLPEYRAIREKYGFLEICGTPELAAEVTLQPVRRLGVDGAVIFADIMTPLIGLGMPIDLVESVGPVVGTPIRALEDLRILEEFDPSIATRDLLETIRLVSADLSDKATVPVIGFSGAPFTLASYLIEGRASRDFARTKRLMFSEPDLWFGLMRRLAEIVRLYLMAQVEAGAQAVQLFDSWAGVLAPADYARFVQPFSSDILSPLTAMGVPTIHFSTGSAGFLENIRDAGGSVIGVDWRISLDEAWRRIGPERGIQGNLDPLLLLGPFDRVQSETARILNQAGGRPGHVFNLGHGIHPQTSPDDLLRLVDFVHRFSAGSSASSA